MGRLSVILSVVYLQEAIGSARECAGEKMNAKHRTLVVIVLILGLAVSGCGLGQLFAPAPTLTPKPTATPAFSPTPIATATKTLAPTPESGKLTGKLLGKTSSQPMAGAYIFLCKMVGTSCQTDPSLTTRAESDGTFGFQTISAGNYVILYNPGSYSNKVGAIMLDLSPEAMNCAVEGFMQSVSVGCQGKVPIFGKGNLTLAKGSEMGVSATGFSLSNASIFSSQYALFLDFENGKPILAEIIAGQTTNITINVWGR